GHAGLFSTGAELRVLLDLLINRGTSGGHQYIRPQVIDLFLKPGSYLGWMEPRGAPDGSFAHGGFTGTYVMGVPKAKLAFVLLTNRQNVGANAQGYFTNDGPIRDAVTRVLLDALAEPGASSGARPPRGPHPASSASSSVRPIFASAP